MMIINTKNVKGLTKYVLKHRQGVVNKYKKL